MLSGAVSPDMKGKNRKTTSGLRATRLVTHNPEVIGSSLAPTTIKSLLPTRKAAIFSARLQLFWTSPFSGHRGDPNHDPDGSKNAPGGGNTASGLFRFRGRFFCLQCCRQDPFHGFCCLLLGCYCDMGISVQGEPALKYPSIPDTTLVSTPFWKASVAKVCRRSWNLTRGSPARFSTWWSKLSGEMGPPVGEGNTQGLLTVFFLCCFRTWMVSSACGIVR